MNFSNGIALKSLAFLHHQKDSQDEAKIPCELDCTKRNCLSSLKTLAKSDIYHNTRHYYLLLFNRYKHTHTHTHTHTCINTALNLLLYKLRHIVTVLSIQCIVCI